MAGANRTSTFRSVTRQLSLIFRGHIPTLQCRCRYAGRTAARRRFAAILVTAIFVVLFGLAFGSFLNVCIARLPQHASLVRPGSHCPDCSAPIQPVDNIPLLSWIALRGRCRSCRHAISWRYPAVEFAVAALFLLSFLRLGLTLTGIGMDVLCFLLLGLAVMDAETMRLPDVFTLTGIGLGVLYAAVRPAEFLTQRLWHAGEAVLWAFLAALVLLLIRWGYLLVRHVEGMGMGDVKLLAMIAAWLGPGPTLLTLVLGTLATAIFGVLALLVAPRHRRSLATRLPLGSFLCVAALYTIFAGQAILHWYAKFLVY
ncbi:MAG: prepilin peptidase [Acidobacteriaceae bacterium]